MVQEKAEETRKEILAKIKHQNPSLDIKFSHV